VLMLSNPLKRVIFRNKALDPTFRTLIAHHFGSRRR
jgi:hypothetical protein